MLIMLWVVGTDGDRHSATLSMGQPGVLHGVRTYVLQSKTGQIIETHSISAGLDYPGVGPEHAWLKDSGRAEYVVATDEEALRGFRILTQREGIIPGKIFHVMPLEELLLTCLRCSLGVIACHLASYEDRQNPAKGPGYRGGASYIFFYLSTW
jgi:hypothetical protein